MQLQRWRLTSVDLVQQLMSGMLPCIRLCTCICSWQQLLLGCSQHDNSQSNFTVHLTAHPMCMMCVQGAMHNSFGSTCHGAGRALSRSAAMRGLDSIQVSVGAQQQHVGSA